MALFAHCHLWAEASRLYTSDRLTSMVITCIAQDSRGYMWIGTQNGLNRFDGYRFTPYLYSDTNQRTICHNNVTTLFVDRSGTLWVGSPKGLSRYDMATESFERVKLRPGNLPEPRITQLVQLRNGQLLVGTSGFGLYALIPPTRKDGRWTAKQSRRYAHGGTDDYYTAIHVDTHGRLWKGDNLGRIFCYTPQGELLLKTQPNCGVPVNILNGRAGDVVVVCRNGVMIYSDALHQTFKSTTTNGIGSAYCTRDNSLLVGAAHGMMRFGIPDTQFAPVSIENRDLDFSTANVTAIFEDRQRNLWIGCSGRGLLFVARRQENFANWSLSDQGIRTGSVLNAVARSANGGLWASIAGTRLYHFNAKGRVDRQLSVPEGINFVYSDAQGKLWIGAGQTLYYLSGMQSNVAKWKKFDCDFLQSLVDDGQGHLYLGTFGRGVTCVDTRTGAMRLFSMFDKDRGRGKLCNNWMLAMLYDSHHLLWIATSAGVSCYDPAKDSFKPYGWHNLLDGYACLSLAEDRHGNLLIGTDRGLFRFDRRRNKVSAFPGRGELGDKSIGAIVAQGNGDVWCSTSMGIWHYRAGGQWIGHINDNGLREREYNTCNAILPDGRIVFGYGDGLVVFAPNNIRRNVKRPADIMLSEFLVGGVPVNSTSVSNGQPITDEAVSLSKHFELSYIDNSFTMEFANFDFDDAANLTLEYSLNGYAWTRTDRGQNAITFTHLQPGTYKIAVRAMENGQYSGTQVYTIVIRSPWYQSTVAYMVYLLILMSIVAYVMWRYRRRQQQALAEEKMQLLINATHDIRTPLTLILSPLHALMKKRGNDVDTTDKLNIIDHNAHRILTLVNQILDIRKIDKRQMRLQLIPTQLVPYINNVYKAFEPYAKDRGITFLFVHPDSLEACVDQVQFDKVIQNLLSNAFKFTPDGGSIKIKLETIETIGQNRNGQQNTSAFKLSVTDTGTGLRETEILKLFTRFYQSVYNQAVGKDGTGIGLNLCKMIVEMHHGTITARNRTDGVQGSVFEVTVPIGDIASWECREQSAVCSGSSQTNMQPFAKTGKRPMILLVDDDAEITDYIVSQLSANYKFHTSQNGKEALHELLSGKTRYDLVVSDIMMPEMDGFTLLRTIKANPEFSYLPVILLTSESAVGNRLEGLQQGADAFLAKPFLMEELKVTIDNLLAKNFRLKDKYSGAERERKEQVEQRDVNDNDKQLMDRIMQSINKNLDNSDYTVETMSADAGLSRSQLHRKMKELTGLSPSEFLRNLRLEQAARLLRERKANVSQVAYAVGFSTLGNFSKAFKQHFGVSPTEYAAQGK